MKRTLITLLTAGAVSAAAFAGVASARSNDNGRGEVQAFLNAPQTIAAAIAAAEAASGGAAVAAEFDAGGYYEVDAIANGEQVSMKIDAASGKILKTEYENDADDDKITDAAQLGAPLSQLVAMAEQDGAGRVMSINAQSEDGQVAAIMVELAAADGVAHDFSMTADGAMTQMRDGHEGHDEKGGHSAEGDHDDEGRDHD